MGGREKWSMHFLTTPYGKKTVRLEIAGRGGIALHALEVLGDTAHD